MPLRILSRPTVIRRFLVSSFLADVTQHIHSLRASGVISVQASFTMGSDSIALRKSAGILTITLVALSCLIIFSISFLSHAIDAARTPNGVFTASRVFLSLPLYFLALIGLKSGNCRYYCDAAGCEICDIDISVETVVGHSRRSISGNNIA